MLNDCRLDSYVFSHPLVALFAAISAIEFYGSNGNRRLAEDTGDSISITRTNVPAWLLLGATFASSVYQWIMIAWCYPSGGRHKAIAVPMNIDFAIHRYVWRKKHSLPIILVFCTLILSLPRSLQMGRMDHALFGRECP